MQRFYFELELLDNLLIDDKDFFHQVSHVLRSLIGDEIIIFNGDSYEYVYEIKEITKKGIKLNLKEQIKNIKDSNIVLNLFQALPNKYEKIEYILQKGVEIGIRNFNFFYGERSQKLVINDKKIERFNFIIKESLEQCGGNILPKLNFLAKLDLASISGEKLVFHTKTEKSIQLRDLQISNNEINLFVGPEGGFSDREISNFQNNSFKIVNFGERVLRTETTGIVTSFYLLNK